MTDDKPVDYTLVDLTSCKSTSTEPTGEMRRDLNVGLESRNRITAGLQIESELLQDCAQMAGAHPAWKEGAKGSLLNQLVSRSGGCG